MPPRYNPSIRRIRPVRNRTQRSAPPPSRKLSADEIEKIRALMKEQLGGREPRVFQLDLVQAQEERRDALCQAATGQGKTAVTAGPYVLEKNADRVTIMVSPLIGLQNEMAETFRNEFKLSAIAVNSSTDGGCSSELMTEIVRRKYRIILISPEMLLSPPFINGVLRHPSFARRVYSVIIDEAHCISHWGADFRKQYGQIGMIRVFLPCDVPFVALSASLTERVIQDIVRTLQFDHGSGFLFRNLGNDRSNVSLVVRAIHNSQQSFLDLDFIIPSNISSPSDIPKTWIYADNIDTGTNIIDHLRERLPPEYHDLICPYNAVHDDKYREEAMKLFREGKIRILVCTDAAGMGCNIPDIDVVIQWKLPAKLSSFIQHAGHAARDPSRRGLAVLLVEPAAYSILTTAKNEEGTGMKAKRLRPNQGKAKGQGFWKKATTKGYAASRGRLRGTQSCLDTITPCQEPEFDPDDPSEGLYNFVQATTCRRSIIGDVFNNPRLPPPCCDLCDPTLLDRTRPSAKQVSRGRAVQYAGTKCDALIDVLEQWREDTMERDEPHSLLPPSSILPDSAVDKLATLVLPISRENVQRFLAPQWPLWPKYGDELATLLLAVDVLADSSSDECRVMPNEETCRKRARSDSAAPVIDGAHRPSSLPCHIFNSIRQSESRVSSECTAGQCKLLYGTCYTFDTNILLARSIACSYGCPGPHSSPSKLSITTCAWLVWWSTNYKLENTSI
ncbi:hypothetical protein EWM64_g9407 [Hericium alpestre]|uniref:DNA 3'-5' helicase n=1 Tax=Hericium alpestre TaxID=135208 RepID=A0A4Y9ZJH7_9AGAM|nr:hypothetical protein EWM64_g9407 [Hericium alpestre]